MTLDKGVKFKYRRYSRPSRPGTEYGELPLLMVRVRYGRKHIDLNCLVDSGAGECIFDTDIAEILGIDLSKAEKRVYFALGDTPITGYRHKVMMRVKGFDDWLSVTVGFVAENDLSLLGQKGFFENYEVTFRTYQKRLEIKSKPAKS